MCCKDLRARGRRGEPAGLSTLARARYLECLEAISDHWREKVFNHSRVEPLVGGERVGVGEDVVPEPAGDEQHRARLKFAVDPWEIWVRDRTDG